MQNQQGIDFDIKKTSQSLGKETNLINMLSLSLQHSSDIVIITDTKGIVKYANPSFERITGFKKDEIINNNMKILQSGKQDTEFYKHMWDTISNGNIWQGTIINRKKEGDFHYENMTIIPMKDDDGKICNYIAVQRDLTDYVYIEKDLVKKNKEISALIKVKDKITNVIIKELKKPIEHIKGFIEIILNQKKDESSEDVKAYLNLCSQKIDKVKSLSDDLVRITRMKTSGVILQMKYDNVEILVDKLVDELQDILKDKNLQVEIEKNIKLHKLYFDKEHIREVLSILILESIKSSPENSIIKIYLRETNGFLDIGICDQGEGIPPDLKEHIFDRSEGNAVNRYSDGTLALCKDIVEQHNGRIWVESKMGKGTTYVFRLPIEKRTQIR